MKCKKSAVCAALLLTLSALSVTSSAAATLYATNGAGLGLGGGASSLYTIDTTTGLATLVGATGFNEVVGIDFNPLNGKLYGVSNGSQQLLTINLTTGAGTAVATLSPSFQSPDLAFSATGTLYSWSEPGPDHLNRINTTTGATTDVGPSGVGTFRTGLGIRSGTIYMKNGDGYIYTIDPITGAATLVSSTAGFRNTLAFDPAGLGFTLDLSGYLYGLNVMSGAFFPIGSTGVSDMAGLAFAPENTVPVPAALPLFATGLAGLGWLARRRKKQTAAA